MIILASASPRRKDLLSLLVNEFEVRPADIDETPHAGETPEDYVLRMAAEKAAAIAETGRFQPADIIIASDTSVVKDNVILGKPESLSDAKRMLRLLSDTQHQVMTSLCVRNVDGGRIVTKNVVSTVTMRPISDLEIEQYWRSGEPQDKAGSYAIQGLGSVFVSHISGSFSAVVGLPTFETARYLSEFGVAALREKICE